MNKYKQYFALEADAIKRGFTFERSEIISDFTSGRKDGLTQLTPHEYNELIRWMQRTFSTGYTPEQIKANLMRRKIISMFRKMGWHENGQADMERIYAWVVKYGYLKKRMNDYTYAELPALVTQVEKVLQSYIESV